MEKIMRKGCIYINKLTKKDYKRWRAIGCSGCAPSTPPAALPRPAIDRRGAAAAALLWTLKWRTYGV